MESSDAILISACCIVLIIAGCMWYKLRIANRQCKTAENKLDILEMKVNDLQLETLESRLNPHLFKNILNSIQSHAYQTYFAMDKLANVLDYILYESRKKFVTPKDEIAFALNLVEINKIKISPLFDLKIKLRINENESLYEQPLLAPLVTTDLIENAFKHADLQSADAFLSVMIEFNNNNFMLTVSNKISDRKMLKKENSGIGTADLEQRLRIIYKDHFRLERFAENDVYTAHLKINLLGYKNQMRTAG